MATRSLPRRAPLRADEHVDGVEHERYRRQHVQLALRAAAAAQQAGGRVESEGRAVGCCGGGGGSEGRADGDPSVDGRHNMNERIRT